MKLEDKNLIKKLQPKLKAYTGKITYPVSLDEVDNKLCISVDNDLYLAPENIESAITYDAKYLMTKYDIEFDVVWDCLLAEYQLSGHLSRDDMANKYLNRNYSIHDLQKISEKQKEAFNGNLSNLYEIDFPSIKYVSRIEKTSCCLYKYSNTGRLYTTKPNLQGLSDKSNLTDDGYVISIDYSQQEIYILSYIIDDPSLINGDVYTTIATKLGYSRNDAKAILLGIIYGISAETLSHTLNCTIDKAKTIISKVNEMFPKINDYKRQIKEKYDKGEYITSLYNRQRACTTLTSAYNFAIQGTGADILKRALIQLDNLDVDILLTVHDEIIFNYTGEDVDNIIKQITDIMNNVFKIPLKTKVKILKGA